MGVDTESTIEILSLDKLRTMSGRDVYVWILDTLRLISKSHGSSFTLARAKEMTDTLLKAAEIAREKARDNVKLSETGRKKIYAALDEIKQDLRNGLHVLREADEETIEERQN